MVYINHYITYELLGISITTTVQKVGGEERERKGARARRINYTPIQSLGSCSDLLTSIKPSWNVHLCHCGHKYLVDVIAFRCHQRGACTMVGDLRIYHD